MACAVQSLTHYQTYLERPPGADLPPKKVNNLGPMYPTEESSFFSIALVRAAGRKKIADQYVCGSPGNKPGAPYPFDGDRCLPGCLFNASCPSSLELDPYITTQTKSTSRALKPCAN